MSQRNIWLITYLVLAIVMIICFIIAIYVPFMMIPGSLLLIALSVLVAIKNITKYNQYKHYIEKMRYEDAFLYADEMGEPDAMTDFSYSKKVERKLRADKFYKWLKVFTPFVIIVLGIMIFYYTIKMLIGV